MFPDQHVDGTVYIKMNLNYSPSRAFAPFNATIRVWLFSVPEFDGKGVYIISVYGRLSLPPHTLYRFKTVSDAYVVFMTCIFQRYGHLPRILAQVKMIFLAERKFVSTLWLYHYQTFATIRPSSAYPRLLSVSIPFHLHPPLSTRPGFASVPTQKYILYYISNHVKELCIMLPLHDSNVRPSPPEYTDRK